MLNTKFNQHRTNAKDGDKPAGKRLKEAAVSLNELPRNFARWNSRVANSDSSKSVTSEIRTETYTAATHQ
jgi:hypothetical protein